MKTKTKFSHRVIAVFFTLNFLQTLIPYNQLWANNNGPTAPEATSFEPVDATDMVNLNTGAFTYVLPMLNVPSPEGGYPVALSYHGGIGMEQQASWVGLGWTLNPGAINRTVNGYPDDYKSAKITEYFYDEGGLITSHHASLGYSAGAFSVSTGVTWGSHQSVGGYVSAGVGLQVGTVNVGANATIGTERSSVGVSATFASGLSLGASIDSTGEVGGNLGFSSNSGGFSIGATSAGTYSVGFNSKGQGSLGVSFSSSGISANVSFNRSSKGGGASRSFNAVSGVGIGLRVAFSNSVSMGDYTTSQSGFLLPITVPTPVGIFSFTYGNQRLRYYISRKKTNYINAPMYFKDGTFNETRWKIICHRAYPDEHIMCHQEYFDSYEELEEELEYLDGQDCLCDIEVEYENTAFMDTYEVPLYDNKFAEENRVEHNNISFPAYDSYMVQAQGLSGTMSSRVYDNGALFGFENNLENAEGYKIKYRPNGRTLVRDIEEHLKFNKRPSFHFDNELTTYLGINTAEFYTLNELTQRSQHILSYYKGGVPANDALPDRITSNHVTFFTNKEIKENATDVYRKGFLKPRLRAESFNRASTPDDGIGAFKITAPDGKTYHYSLPVYNHEMVSRTIGEVKYENSSTPKPENESYFEKRQLEPYATHWLLTAVTGPDFIDNGDGIAGEGDLGYWVDLSYGKWSDSYIWRNPSNKDFIESKKRVGVKTVTHGRKDVFYLNEIKTRTHTGIFVKEESPNESSRTWTYKGVDHIGRQNKDNYKVRSFVYKQHQLRLDKVILIKNEDIVNLTTDSPDDSPSVKVSIKYNHSEKENVPAHHTMLKNVYTKTDIPSSLYDKAIKVVDLQYGTLVRGNERSSLASVGFRGKGNKSVIPRYQFKYIEPNYTYNVEDVDEWGYNKIDPSYWSLNEIITPQGGSIKVDYEEHRSKSIITHAIKFREGRQYDFRIMSTTSGGTEYDFIIQSPEVIEFGIGDKLDIDYHQKYCDEGYTSDEDILVEKSYKGKGTITRRLDGFRYGVKYDGNVITEEQRRCYGEEKEYVNEFTAEYPNPDQVTIGAGIRVKNVELKTDTESYKTIYTYGENGSGIGTVSYYPFADELEEELPYSAELPFPRVMYEYVAVQNGASEAEKMPKNIYKFEILKNKDENRIKYDDLYEIKINQIDSFVQNPTYANNTDVIIKEGVVEDNLASIGRLLEVETFNGENQLMSKTINDYYSKDEIPNKLGIKEEAFQTYKEVSSNDTSKRHKKMIASSKRIKYPSILKQTTEIKGGNTYTTRFEDRNPISGQARKVITENSFGESIVVESMPAFERYAKMSSKVIDDSNKNMLTQVTASQTYLIDADQNIEVLDASVDTWRDWGYNVWRKKAMYRWNGALTTNGGFENYDVNSFGNFNWNLDIQTNSNWEKISETLQYNHFSKPLETVDINGNKAAVKYDIDQTKVFAVANAAYSAMFYSGAEDIKLIGSHNLGGGVYKDASTVISSEKVHTGKYSIKANTSQKPFYVTVGETNKYRVSVWVDKANYTGTRLKVGNAAIIYEENEKVFAGNWVQLNFYTDTIVANEEIALINGTGISYFDDFRVYPITSTMTSYVYNEWEELTHILGSNNLATRYEYDDAGRLKRVYEEVVDQPGLTGGFKLSTEHNYHYANYVEDPYLLYPLEANFGYQAGPNPRVEYVVAEASEGSGEYQYRWGVEYGRPPTNFSSWGNNDRVDIPTCEREEIFVRCEVRDVQTQEVISLSRSIITDCYEQN